MRSDDDGIPLVSGSLRVPRVVHLLRYDRTPRVTVRLTRRNLMFRDAHQCQYCGKRPPLRELNIDHVVPRSRGGDDSWENLVTACRTCNLRKGWKTPEEANMRLARRPFRPKWTMTAQILLGSGWRFKEWEPFLEGRQLSHYEFAIAGTMAAIAAQRSFVKPLCTVPIGRTPRAPPGRGSASPGGPTKE